MIERNPAGMIADTNMKPPDGFMVQLHAYDSKLGARFAKCDQAGKQFGRWQITREGSDGQLRHIMFVVGEGMEFRPLDRRVLDRLAKCDSSRYLNKESFMHALGMKTGRADPYMEQWESYEEQRYHEHIEELGDRLQHAMKNDPTHQGSHEAEELALRRADAMEGAREAYEEEEGKVEWDYDLQCPKRTR